MQVHCDEGIANHIGPEPCVVGREAGGEASAGVRIGQPLSRERINRDADAVVTAEGETGMRVNASAFPVLRGPRPWHVRKLLDRKPGDLDPRAKPGGERSASGRRRAEADDARGRGVGLRHSSCEADERGRATGRGVRGAKGGGQGERGTGRHAPDTEPARRVPRTGPRAASRTLRRQHPRWEPDALIGPVRFCAGGAQQ